MQTIHIGFVLGEREKYDEIKDSVKAGIESHGESVVTNLFYCDSKESLVQSGTPVQIIVIEPELAIGETSLISETLKSGSSSEQTYIILVSPDASEEQTQAATTPRSMVYLNPWLDINPLVRKLKDYISLLSSNAREELPKNVPSKTANYKLLETHYAQSSLMSLMEKLNKARTQNAVISELHSTCSGLGLDSVIILSSSASQNDIYPKDSVSGAESTRLLAAGKRGHFVQINDNCSVISFEELTLVIRNMPVESEDLFRRVRDYGGLLVRSGHSRLATIKVEQVAAKQRSLLKDVMGLVHKRLDNLNDRQRKQQLHSSKVTMELVETLDRAIGRVNMSPADQKVLKDMLHAKIQLLIEVNNWGMDTLVELDSVLDNVASSTPGADVKSEPAVETQSSEATAPNTPSVD
jgi:hypothetical protein